jgi:hypothetical protein
MHVDFFSGGDHLVDEANPFLDIRGARRIEIDGGEPELFDSAPAVFLLRSTIFLTHVYDPADSDSLERRDVPTQRQRSEIEVGCDCIPPISAPKNACQTIVPGESRYKEGSGQKGMHELIGIR